MAVSPNNVVLNFQTNGQVQYAQTIKQINMVMQTASKEYTSQITAMGRNADATAKLRAEKQKLETQLVASSQKVEMLRDEFEAMQNDSTATAEDLQKLYNQVLAAETAHSKLEQAMSRATEGLTEEAIATREATAELKNLSNDAKLLEAEQRRLTSSFELQSQALGQNASESERAELALRQYQQQTELTERAITNLERQLDTARRAYGDNSAEVMQLETRLNQTRAELNNFGNGLDAVSTDAQEAEKSLESLKDGAKKLGAATAAALAGIGAASVIAAGQFDNAIGQIQSGLGITREEAEALEGQARNVWKAGFGESLEEVAAGLIRVKQNMKEIDGSEIEVVTKNAFALAKTFESDVNEVTRAGNNLMTNFGISAEEAFDMMTKGAQNGLNFSNEMFDNLAEYAPLFADLGFSAEEMFGTLISGSKEGVYNLDYLNDMVKEFGIRLFDGSKKTKDAMASIFSPDNLFEFGNALKANGKSSQEYLELVSIIGETHAEQIAENIKKTGKAGQDAWTDLEFNLGRGRELMDGITDGSISGQAAMTEIAQAIASIEDPMTRTSLGVELFGTKFEDLGTEASLAMLTAGESLEGFEGAMNGVIEAQEQTFGQRWESFTRSAASSLEPLGKILLSLAEEWLPKVINAMETGSTWFAELSPSMQGTSVAVAGLVAASGPVVVVIGAIISSLGTLLPLFASGSAGAAALSGALAIATGPIGLTAAAVVALGVAVYDISKNLSESSIELESWGEGVSAATATAIDGFIGISDEVGQELMNMQLTSSTVTDQMANDLTSKFNNMYTQIADTAKAKHELQLTSLQDYFLNSSALTSEEEAKIIGNTQKNHQVEMEVLAAKNQLVAEIMATAAEEKRTLTEREREAINNINEQMKEDAVRVLSESEMEQKIIWETIQRNASEKSALQAAEVVKNAIEQKEKVIAEAEAQFDESMAHIIRMRDESGVITEEQADKMIAEAKKSRDQTIAYAEEMHEEIVDEAKLQAEEHVDQVDWETGEIKSKWEVMKNDVSKKMSEIGKNIKDDWSEAYTDAKKSVSDMATSVNGKFQEIGENIGVKMNNARDAVKEAIDKIKGFFNFNWSLPKLKVPKFSVSPAGWKVGDLLKGDIPKLGVEWFAKGGIMTRPTAFGINGSNIMAGGEAGPEAILPLNEKTLGEIGKAIAGTMPNNFPENIVTQLVMNDRILAEALTPIISQLQRDSNVIAAKQRGRTI